MGFTRRDTLEISASIFGAQSFPGDGALLAGGGQSGGVEGWPMVARDPRNSAYNPTATPPKSEPQKSWVLNHETDGPKVEGPPLVASGTLLQWARGRSAVVALDARTGTQQWRHSLLEGIQGDGMAIAGDVVVVSTAAGVRALALADGTERWQTPLETVQGWPRPADDIVIVPADYGLQALDIQTGAKQWSTGSEFGALFDRCAVTDAAVYATNANESLIRFARPTGEIQWSRDIDRSGPVTVADDTVYIGGQVEEESGVVRAFGAENGEPLWRYDTRSPLNAPAVAGDTLVITTTDGTVYGLGTDDGQERWRLETGEPIGSVDRAPAVPALANGVAYVGTEDSSLHAVDITNGSKLWSLTLQSSNLSPTVVGDSIYTGWFGTIEVNGGRGWLSNWMLAAVAGGGAVVAGLAGLVAAAVLFYRRQGDDED